MRIRKSEAVLSVGLPWEQAFAHLLAQPILSVCIICMNLQDLMMIGGWRGTFLGGSVGHFQLYTTYCRANSPSLPPIETSKYNLKRYVVGASSMVGWRVVGALAPQKIEVRCGIHSLYLAPLPSPRNVLLQQTHKTRTEDALEMYL